MDVRELFNACKSGNLVKLKHLIETKEVDVNVRDKWDSTPLYYACLCGHLNIVRYSGTASLFWRWSAVLDLQVFAEKRRRL